MSLPLTADTGGAGTARVEPTSTQVEHLEFAEPVSGNSEFDQAWAQGFKYLRFPPSLEARYLQDKEAERLRLIRIGAIFTLLLTNAMLLPDWLMVPDRIHVAVLLRLFVETPVVLVFMWRLERIDRETRERLAYLMALITGAIGVYLSISSHDALGAMYLIALTMILLFNGGVVRLRFWMALRVSLSMLAMFAFGVGMADNPPVAVMASEALMMVSVSIFTLFSSYRAEHEERANWLMEQQQGLLREEVEHTNRQLEKLSRFDALTDLANRRYFDDFLQLSWTRAQREGQDVALLMIDIDHFKAYNDCYGHAQGDACIQRVAKSMTECLRKPEGLVARYGGEEFAVVLPATNLSEALAVAERLRQCVARQNIEHIDSPVSRQVTLSIGVASLKAGGRDASVAGLIACADAALYQAKSQGRNRVVGLDKVVAKPVQMPHGPSVTAAEAPVRFDPVRREVEQELSHIDQAWSPLLFPEQLEARFQRDTAEERVRYFALCGTVAFLVFNGFLLVDALLVPDVIWLAIKVRLGLFTPAAAGLLAILWVKRDWVLRRWPPMLTETLVQLSGVAAAVCMGYILSASQLPTSQLYHAGLMVVIVYGNLVQRLRFWYALVASLMIYAVHIACVVLLPAFNQRLTLPLLALIGASVIFSMMANHALERDQRRRYLLNLMQTYVLKDLGDVRARLQRLSRMDALTGLYNRRHFQSYFESVWQRAQHDGGDVAIIMMDVDHFKKFNDRYGHQAGDACLAKVAEAMRLCLRQPGDLVARYGGEEFIAVLPKATPAMAQAAAERVRLAIAALQIPHADSSAAAYVTASVGVASLAVQSGQVDAALIRLADDALYRAKREGRNRVAVHR